MNASISFEKTIVSKENLYYAIFPLYVYFNLFV